MTATRAKTASWVAGIENSTSNCERARVTRAARKNAERKAERRSDQRGDDALVPHHPPHLPPRHADCPQHPELARPLEDRQHERVDHAEHADDDGEGKQDVEQEQELVELLVLEVIHASRVCTFASGKLGNRLLEAGRRGRVVARRVHEDERVPRAFVERVECGL